MRLLMTSAESPTPVTNGFRLRLYGLLSALRAEHDIHLVCYGESVDLDGVHATVVPPPTAWGLGRRVAEGALGWMLREPSAARSSRQGGLATALTHVAGGNDFDAVHVAHGAIAFAADCVGGLPRVLDAVDAWSLAQREEIKASPTPQFLSRLTLGTIARHERAWLRRFDATVVVAERDRAVLQALDPAARVKVIPNGVDTLSFAPDSGVARLPGLVVFHGTMNYPPNVQAALFLIHEVMPRVRTQVPGARLRLIGRGPVPQLLGLAGPQVEITGTVTDVRPWLLEAEVAVCPMRRGTGIKNKLLEAGALGLPIVATRSALGDVDLRDGHEVLIRDEPAAIAAAIVELLGDPAARRRLGEAAHAVIAQRWGWEGPAQSFTELYREIVQTSRQRTR
jgi:glycosyltransferase involved in cell wall biosynthesis